MRPKAERPGAVVLSKLKNIFPVQFGPLLGNGVYVVEIAAFALAIPYIQESYHLTDSQAPYLYSVYSISLSVSLLLGGYLGDRISIGVVFSIGLIVFAIGGFGILSAYGFVSLILWRVAQGIGAGLFSPAVPVLLTRHAKKGSADALTKWGAISGLGAAFSPWLFAVLSEYQSWKIAWFPIPAFSLLAFVLFLGHLKKTSRNEISHTFVPNAGFCAGIFYVFICYGMTTWIIYSIPYVAIKAGVTSKIDSGLLLTMLWVVFSAVCYLMKAAVGNKALKAYLFLGPIFCCVAIFLLAFAADYRFLALAAFLGGCGMALNNMPTTHFILLHVPYENRAFAASLDIVAARLGGAFAVGVVTYDSEYLPVAAILSAAMCLGLVGTLAKTCRAGSIVR